MTTTPPKEFSFTRVLKCLAIATTLMLCAVYTEAQVNKEVRVYYLDITDSMAPIWEEVTDNLKRAINNVSDETTTLEVVAWTDSKHTLQRSTAKANDKGKKKLCSFIDNIKREKKCYTEIYVPFNDFYSRYTNSTRETYFYLMTDGANYSKTRSKLDSAINSWKSKTSSSCYGFYVMLSEDAAAKDIENEVANQNAQLWTVKTADVNINHVKLLRSPIYTVRSSEYFDVPIDGDFGGASFKFLSTDSYYKVSDYNIVKTNSGDKAIRIYVDKISNNLPVNHTWQISVNASNLPNFTFLLNKSLSVKCVNEPFSTLKFTFKD